MVFGGGSVPATWTLTFNLVPKPCTYVLTPVTQAFDPKGGTGSIALATDDTCSWVATSQAPWIVIAPPASGSGNAGIRYSVAPNPGNQPRLGSITIADQIFVVIQDGNTVDEPCKQDSGSSATTDCENQDVSIDPPIVGTPFELHYQSERVPGRNGASSFLATFVHDLGGWTLNIRHAYDPGSGNLYLGSGVRRRQALLGSPPILNGSYLVTNESGSEVYVFDNTGRHVRTRQALTGAVVYEFAYDANGHLKTVTDTAGNVTTFQRDANGNLNAIVGPYGQTTAITINADGYITQITNPNREPMKLTYGAGGLVTSMTDALGNVDKFQYDSQGLLMRADHAGGASEDLVANNRNSPPSVKLTTAAGVTTTFATDFSMPGREAVTVQYASGVQGSTESTASSFSASPPDGTQLQMAFMPDPRWGIQAPVAVSSTITTPSGNQSNGTETRGATLSNPTDPFSVSALTDSISINGRQSIATYDGASRTLSTVSPAGQTGSATFDSNGRTIRLQAGGLDPTGLTYDSHGRLNLLTFGSGPAAATTSFSYSNQGFLASLTDATQRMFGFEYDAAGRVIKQNLPQGTAILYGYNAIGNLTSLTPPGRNAHTFTYGAGNRLMKYSPPGVDGASGQISLAYNADGQVTSVARGSQPTTISYDNAGRQAAIALSSGTVSYAYDSATGNLAGIIGPGDVALSFQYDGSLLIQQTWSGAVSGAVATTFDNNFFPISQSINNAATVDYQLNADGLPIQAGSLSISRDAPTGLPTGTAIDNIADSFSYDSLGRVSTYSASVSGSPEYSVQYARDPLGRIMQRIEMIQGVTDTYLYTYDAAGRLASVTKDGDASAAYSYDANGNRLSFTGTSGSSNGQYDAQDRLVSYGSFTYIYASSEEFVGKWRTQCCC